jgi:hypothetical protein
VCGFPAGKNAEQIKQSALDFPCFFPLARITVAMQTYYRQAVQ